MVKQKWMPKKKKNSNWYMFMVLPIHMTDSINSHFICMHEYLDQILKSSRKLQYTNHWLIPSWWEYCIILIFEFSGIFILFRSLLEKRIVPSKYWKMKWLETVVSLIFFWGVEGGGITFCAFKKIHNFKDM